MDIDSVKRSDENLGKPEEPKTRVRNYLYEKHSLINQLFAIFQNWLGGVLGNK
jgi:hypothetical protein